MPDTPAEIQRQHVVLFSFPEPLSSADEEWLRSRIAAWPRTIGTMTECRLGRDLTGARTRGYSHLLHTVFPDAATLAAYIEHPAHVEVVGFLDAKRCTRLAFDFVIDSGTDFSSCG
jgi:hypothetical protein